MTNILGTIGRQTWCFDQTTVSFPAVPKDSMFTCYSSIMHALPSGCTFHSHSNVQPQLVTHKVTHLLTNFVQQLVCGKDWVTNRNSTQVGLPDGYPQSPQGLACAINPDKNDCLKVVAKRPLNVSQVSSDFFSSFDVFALKENVCLLQRSL